MKLQFEFAGKQINLLAQKIGNKVWLHYKGINFCIEDEDSTSARAKKKKHHGPHSGEILAPMPGKVTKLMKREGNFVKKGEAILVMEAMKMEYTLKAEGNGIIEKILCSTGDQVILGKLLIKIKPEANNG